MPYGGGFVLHLGWDWFFDDSEEAEWPAWFDVLERGAGAATPPPTTTTTEAPTTTTTTEAPVELVPAPRALSFVG